MRRILLILCVLSAPFPTLASYASTNHEVVASVAAARNGHQKEVAVEKKDVLWKAVVVASYYAHYFHGRKMANGDPFNMYGYTVAHKTLPLGTEIRVCRGETCVDATVTDRGPFIPGRDLDVSYQIALDLGLTGPGHAPVLMEVLA